MTRFTKTKKALRALTDTILGGSSNVVRTLKVAGRSLITCLSSGDHVTERR